MRFFFFHFKFSVFNISLGDYVYCSGFGRRRFLSWVDRFLSTSRRPQSRKQHKHQDPKLLGIIRLATKRNCPVALGFVACDVHVDMKDGSPVEIWSSACVGIVMRTGGNLDSAKRWLTMVMNLFLLRYGAKYFGDGNGESYKFLVLKKLY